MGTTIAPHLSIGPMALPTDSLALFCTLFHVGSMTEGINEMGW